MAISDDLNSIRTHLEDDYEALEQLGVSVEDRNIENIKDMAQQIYAKFPKTEFQEGTSVTIENGLKGKIDFDDGKVGFGQASQESTQGYNIMRFIPVSNANVTVVVNNDGSITLNGIGNVGIPIQEVTLQANTTYSQKIEQISGSISGVSIDGAFMSFNGTQWLSTSNRVVATPPESVNKSSIWLHANAVFNNLRVKIWGYEGNTNKDFEPYTGGYASPSPNWEQPIQCVTGNQEIVESGKNEYDVSTNNFTERCALSNGVFSTSALDNRNITFGYTANKFTVLNNETYYFSVDAKINSGTASNLGLMRFNNSGFTVSTIINPNLTNDFQRYVFSATNTSGATINASKILLQLSSTSFSSPSIEFKNVLVSKLSDTSYEPYVTPRTYQFSLGNNKFYNIGTYRDYILRTTGKNKCNITTATGWLYSSGLPGHEDTSIVVDSFESNKITYHSNTNAYLEVLTNNIQLKPNTKYTITFKRTSTATNNQFFIYNYVQGSDYTINYRDNNTNVYEATFTTSDNGVIVLGFGFGNVTGSATVSNIQIEEGSTASDYQPYGVGNWYKVGKIGEYTFTGQEEWTQSGYTTNEYLCCFCTAGIDIGGATELVTDLLSNRFKAGTYTQELGNLISSSNNPNGFNLCIEKSIASDVSALQTYFANNPTYALYIHKKNITYTPITGDLATQLEAFWNGLSNNGTTILESNGDLPMIIKVRGLKGE